VTTVKEMGPARSADSMTRMGTIAVDGLSAVLPRRAGCAIGLDTALQLCQKLCERPRRYHLFRAGMLALACAHELFIRVARTAHRGRGSSDMEAMERCWHEWGCAC